MNYKVSHKSGVCGVIALFGVMLVGGCNSDTSGARTIPPPTKEQINQQIAQLKANANIPESFKQDQLKKLQAQASEAR